MKKNEKSFQSFLKLIKSFQKLKRTINIVPHFPKTLDDNLFKSLKNVRETVLATGSGNG